MGGSILHQLTQVKAATEVGRGTHKLGRGVAGASRGQAIQAGLCFTPGSSDGHARLGATEKAAAAPSHRVTPPRHPLRVPAK